MKGKRTPWITWRELALALACVVLQQLPVAYWMRVLTEQSQTASLAHLHSGLLFAVGMLARRPRTLAICYLAIVLGWVVRVVWLHTDLYPMQDLAWGLPLYALQYLWLRFCSGAMGLRERPSPRRMTMADIPRFFVFGLLLYPLGEALLQGGNNALRALVSQQPGLSLGLAADEGMQILFAKFFGLLVLTLPLVLAATEGGDAMRRRRWPFAAAAAAAVVIATVLLALEDRSLSASVLSQQLGQAFDYHFPVAALLTLLVLRVSPRWSMPALILVQLVLLYALSGPFANLEGMAMAVRLGRTGVELYVLQAMLLLLYIAKRDGVLLRRQLEREQRRDAVTGLPNLHALRQRIGRDKAPAEIGVLLIDGAARIGSSFGLAAEHALMRELWQAIERITKGYYLSGGRFVVSVTSEREACWQALLDGLGGLTFNWEGHVLRVSPYLGVAALEPGGRDTLEASIGAAAAAAEAAQRQGALHPRRALVEEERAQQGELERAARTLALLRAGAVELYLQPIRPLQRPDAPLDAGELLCRLRDGETILSPGEFMPALAAQGRLVELDLAVLAQLERELQENAGRMRHLRRLGVNLGAQSLVSEDVGAALHRLIARLPEWLTLCLELTETAVTAQPEAARELLLDLRARGCLIVIDDFGAGVQSFERLRQVPVDTIKLDGSFVRNVLSDPVDCALVRASVEIAHAFQARIIAEYVENAGIATRLVELGVEWGQGYHLGRPAPLERFLQPLG